MKQFTFRWQDALFSLGMIASAFALNVLLMRWFQTQSLIAMIFVGACAMLVGKILGPWACSLVFGAETLESIDLLVPLLATSTLLMIKSFLSTMMIPLGQRWRLLGCELSGAVLCAVLAIPLTRFFGMQGTNVSYMLGTLLQIGCLGYCVLQTTRGVLKKAEEDV